MLSNLLKWILLLLGLITISSLAIIFSPKKNPADEIKIIEDED